MASHPCPETFQLVRTLRQVSPHGDSFTPSDWPVTGHSPARSDLRRAFTLPEYSTRTKKEYCRLPLSANAFILAIGRYTAVYRPQLRIEFPTSSLATNWTRSTQFGDGIELTCGVG